MKLTGIKKTMLKERITEQMESCEYHLWHGEHVLKKEMESAVSLAYQNEN